MVVVTISGGGYCSRCCCYCMSVCLRINRSHCHVIRLVEKPSSFKSEEKEQSVVSRITSCSRVFVKDKKDYEVLP